VVAFLDNPDAEICLVGELESVSTVTAVPFYRSLGYNMGEKVQHSTSTGVTMDAMEMSKELTP
jgi:hypothetical protein